MAEKNKVVGLVLELGYSRLSNCDTIFLSVQQSCSLSDYVWIDAKVGKQGIQHHCILKVSFARVTVYATKEGMAFFQISKNI